MPANLPDLLAIAPHRREAIESLAAELVPGRTAVLSTHINADGDGCGSETALARLLEQRGVHARIVNPTPWPSMFDFLLEGIEERSSEGARALEGADLLIVLDISDVKRLGALTDAVRALNVPRMVIDHHVASDEPPGELIVSDIAACATGELIFDFARVLDLEITPLVARSLYTAILTDTGGFRFSNTSPRCHAIAGQLLAAGVDPEEMYRRIYASVSVGRIQLLRDALATLEVDGEHGVSWIALPAGALERYGVRAEELDGLAEHPRSVAGTRMAIFFRDLGHGKVKVSFRSTGEVDVNLFARTFGGGGHAKASGALIPGELDEVRERVVAAAREFLKDGREQEAGSRKQESATEWRALSAGALTCFLLPRRSCFLVDPRSRIYLPLMGLFKRASEADGAVEDRIRAAISEVGPLLKLETIHIVLVEFERDSGVATLRFEGDCPHCDMPARMLRDGIEAHLRTHVPEVREVREA